MTKLAERRRLRIPGPRPTAIAAYVAVLVAYLLVGLSVSSDPSLTAAYGVIAVCALSIAILGLRSPVDKSDPLVWMNIAFAVMFGLHPIAMIETGVLEQAYHFRFFLVPTYPQAAALALLATISFNLGYWIHRASTRGGAGISALPLLHSGSEAVDLLRSRLASRLAWLTLLVSLVAYSAFAISVGTNPIAAILGGARRGEETSSTAYLYYAPQMIGPATLLFLYAALIRRKFPLGAVVLGAVQLILFLPGGQRLVLLLTLVPTFLAYFMLQRKRLATGLLVAGTLPILTLVIAMRDLGANVELDIFSAVARFVSNPQEQLLEFATGDDTEMLDALAVELQLVPSAIPHSPLSVLTSTLAAPIPSAFWSGKPQPADSLLNAIIVGTDANSAGLAYSFVGELFYDSSYFGVIIGFLVAGAIAAGSRDWVRRAQSPATILIYCALVPTFISLVRGSLAYALARALFTVGPLVAYSIVERRRLSSLYAADNRSQKVMS
ncbi:O-antigen polysaccharide polymerase Wzy family protein [Microbacterium sp. EYE_5]|uniref:O-antigen polysaccharide polymerase Wzy n=1 Tax=unclassified Microbacterium TaxID=2609290 RepID=UPI00200412B3|nr:MULTISPECIES: O-antigen polysaccharide polymerase Wzy [unclassified Microbacterium]MCK6079044.1 O-antigen polysaccharide polymerase Wzy family protein [Microbacterium sp. EYE_382]MCK6084314.1 O-antigen polysaccharide polymerase Wzy family protein [Microbacterium sp. EYE_384]MCK6123457.1 O-antigen polysaccharide polymerase Wzy family protein [Microbacterium sp. EYE_80]MCK6125078.1 O-antigen polysaccharide polymerase Wzy family protein [Microbacterium sp. EYE_79]MCK6139998.1 O-antigen polysac